MQRLLVTAVLTLTLMGGSAFAHTQDKPSSRSKPVSIENPSWIVPPQVDEEDYPLFALYLNVNGDVTLECAVTSLGSPESCLVIEERPVGLGFGDAAKQIILRHRLNPRRVNGVATPSQFVVRLPFTVYDDDNGEMVDIPVWSGPEPSPALLANARDVVAAVGMPSVEERLGLYDLPDDRRATILSWTEELFPSDDALAESMALGMARLWAKESTDRFIFGENAPQITELEAFSAYSASDFIKIDAEMKRRYCAAYGCEGERP